MINLIINEIETLKQRFVNNYKNSSKGWNKLTGDITVRVLAEFINKNISPTKKVSDPNAYIEGCPTEFDLLIVKGDAKPYPYTNVYKKDDILVALEIKYTGIFSDDDVKRIKNNFDNAKKICPNVNFIYVTLKEIATTKNNHSTNYLAMTKSILSPYEVYCFFDNTSKNINYSNWNKFINQLV